ncbi:MAG: hypothetical protein KYQ20_02375 [Candidatus Nealsonbacteria bacterium]|nr:hypothetical protein [Candidatus Nealsonbacteria bacterium]
MTTITIPKKEYQRLLDRALRYEYLRQILEGDIFASPPTRNIKSIIKEFRATKQYNPKFLESLARGLEHSSYFKQ